MKKFDEFDEFDEFNEYILIIINEIKTIHKEHKEHKEQIESSKNYILLNKKTIKNILENFLDNNISNIVLSYVIPDLSKFHINDTNDVFRRLRVCNSLEYCEQGCEQHLYTHILNKKLYCVSDMINNIQNTDYMIKLALSKIDYVFIHVFFYFYVLGHNIVISKNFNFDDITDYVSFNPTYFYFHCNTNKLNPSGYRLFDD